MPFLVLSHANMELNMELNGVRSAIIALRYPKNYEFNINIMSLPSHIYPKGC
jgi:hypothetical protein